MALTPEERLIVAILEKDFEGGKILVREEVGLILRALAESREYAESIHACLVNIATCEECVVCPEGAARPLVQDIREWAEYAKKS